MKTIQELQPGDLVWVDRSAKGLPYHHCGIYEGNGTVIHFAAIEGSETNRENAEVHRISFKKFQNDCPVKVIDIEGSLPVEETLQRARSLIGKKGYDISTFNCDHFATWCKTGKYHSIQVDKVKTVLLESIGGSLVEFLCTIHDMAEKSKASPFLENDSDKK